MTLIEMSMDPRWVPALESGAKTATTRVKKKGDVGDVFEIDGHRAYIEYEERPGALALNNTIVPEELRGGGIAAALTQAVLEEIRTRGLRIVPECSYVVRYIERHPEWQEIVARE